MMLYHIEWLKHSTDLYLTNVKKKTQVSIDKTTSFFFPLKVTDEEAIFTR